MTTIGDIEERLMELEAQVNELDEHTMKNWLLDISTEDLNANIGRLFVGYGNNCTNRPSGAGNGWLINIPHSSDHLTNKYNKQFWIERTSNKVWLRTQENEVWSAWVRMI